VRWSWGILDAANYLPRVTLGKAILSPARWLLSKEEQLSLKDANSLRKSINALQSKLGLPDIVIVGESDNKLPIHLGNDDHLPTFQKLVQANGIIEEFVMADKLWLSDAQDRRYLNEIVIPFFNLEESSVKTGLAAPVFSGPREFGLQSEWIYFKLYCNFKAANGILLGIVEPLRTSLLEDEVIDSWFFVRYADPLPHIRIRFHGSGKFYNEVTNRLQQLSASFIENGMLSSIMTDTYKREVERYGGENIIAVEDFFFADSEAIMEFIIYSANGGRLSVWEVALAFSDQLLSSFRLHTEERMQVMSDLREAFFAEMKVNKEMKRSMDLARRKNRQSIESILHGTGLDDDLRSILNKRGAKLEKIFADVQYNISAGKSTATIHDILKSCVHMTFNRLFETNARHHEMVLYDYLFSHYASMLARNKVK
jgi:thiopeptide-type bacteriocin biosynthesis protein